MQVSLAPHVGCVAMVGNLFNDFYFICVGNINFVFAHPWIICQFSVARSVKAGSTGLRGFFFSSLEVEK